MSGVKEIAVALGGLLFVLLFLLRAGNSYYDHRDRPTVPRDIPEATEEEYRAGSRGSGDEDYRARYRPNDEAERDYRRRREGVTIDTGNARPMVDVDPNR